MPRITALLAVVAALAGCGPVSGTPKAAPIEAPVPESAPPPKPTVYQAADGTNYEACVDGTCEVEVSGPVAFSIGAGTYEVTKVLDDGIEIRISLTNGRLTTGTMKDRCGGTIHQLSLTGNYGGITSRTCDEDAGPLPAPAPKAGMLQVQMATFRGGKAVLRIVSG